MLLLLPPTASEALRAELSGIGGVFVLSDDRVESHIVVSNFTELAAMGPALLLVDGLDALEPANDSEAAHTVATDLQESVHSMVVLLRQELTDISVPVPL